MTGPWYGFESFATDGLNLGYGIGQGDGRQVATSSLRLALEFTRLAVEAERERPGSVLRPSRPPRSYLRTPSRGRC